MMYACMIGSNRACFVAYDPTIIDARHVAEYRKIITQLIELRLPYSGHPSGFFLSHVGTLQSMVLCTLGEGRVPDLGRRAGKEKSPIYLFSLAERCLQKSWLRAALSLDARADDSDAEVHMQRCKILHHLGDHFAAIAPGRRAVELAPQNPWIAAYVAQLLIERGMVGDATQMVAAARATAPDNPALGRLAERLIE
jgi:hypothetical protein